MNNNYFKHKLKFIFHFLEKKFKAYLQIFLRNTKSPALN